MLATDKIKSADRVGCLSAKQLKMYVGGKMSEQEKHKTENHLLQCEYCISEYQKVLRTKEAKEEKFILEDLAHPDYADKPIISKRRNLFIILVLMISVTVIYGIWYKFNNRKTVFSENPTNEIDNSPSILSTARKPAGELIQTKEMQPEANSSNNIPVINEQTVPVIQQSIVEEKITNPALASSENPNKTKAEKENAEKSIAETNKSKEIIASDVTADKVSKPVEQPVENLPVETTIDDYKVLQSTKEVSYTDQLKYIFKKITKSENTEALNAINSFLATHPSDVNAKYYRGYIYYLLQENDLSMADFNWVLNHRSKTFYQDARWYKALILNRTKNFEDSKSLLTQIIAENGTYALRAKQLIELISDK